jgi:integrase
LRLLSVCYNWAARQEILDGRNPCQGVTRMTVKPSDDRYSLDEVHRLLSLPDLPPSVPTALYTGMRKGELFGLRWADVRFDLGRIDVRHSFDGPTKTDKPRVVPLHRELAPILRAWRERCPETQDGLVFPICARGHWQPANTDSQGATHDLRELLKRAGCRANFPHPWHAIRHTFATLVIEAGGSTAAVERILGHSTSGNRITAGYTHVDLPFLAREIDKLSLTPPSPATIISLAAHRATA